METFRAVLCAGADAVYVGGSAFGARAYAHNLSKEELLAALDEAHIHGRKVYLTVNTLCKETELEERLYDYLLPYYEHGLDAVIVQDFGVLSLVKSAFPGLSIHASTQMSVSGEDGAMFLKQQGVKRVVVSRELSLEEIARMKEQSGLEIESFVHGALCYSYSGQCLMSSLLGGRSGNRGRCAQPCRLPYEALDDHHESLSGRALYLLSPKDLCAISLIPQLAQSGVDSFKIEGRMKQAAYAAGVTAIYRKYIDRYAKYGQDGFAIAPEDQQKLLDLGSRSGFTKGYYLQRNGADMITFENPSHAKERADFPTRGQAVGMDGALRAKIKGKLKLSPQKNAILSVSFRDFEAIAEGGMVDCAKSKPLILESVREKLCKTGNTPFDFGQLEIEMDKGSFLPIGQLNALRRDALGQLAEQILAPYQREAVAMPKACPGHGKINQGPDLAKPSLSVALESDELLQAVSSRPYVSRIYLEANCFCNEGQALQGEKEGGERIPWVSSLAKRVFRLKALGKEVFLALPHVFRRPTRERFEQSYQELQSLPLDGMLIRNYEELGFLLGHGYPKAMVADHHLPAWSNRAQSAFFQCKIAQNTVPLELNWKELRQRDCSQSELLIYGYLPLMVSAGCVHQSLGRCKGTEEVLFLKDRYGKEFAVKNHCADCYNVIYNSVPLALFGQREEIAKLPFPSLRIHFSIESVARANKILDLYEAIFCHGEAWKKTDMEEYTNGHLKRGVE